MRKSRDKEIGYTANQATYNFEIVKFIFPYEDVPHSPWYTESCSFARVSDLNTKRWIRKSMNF